MPDKEQVLQELDSCSIEGVMNAKNLEEYWISSVGLTLYEKFINQYSKKMWQVSDNTIIDTFSWSPKGVALKRGPRAAWDVALSGYPYAENGYDDYFKIGTNEATVLLSTQIEEFDIEHKRVKFNSKWNKFDVIVNTISPDLLFDSCFGELPFIGRDFHKIVLPIENAFPQNVFFIYFANSESFTRIVEYKKFTLHKSSSTLLGLEIPSRNGKHYPLPIKAEIARAKKYLDLLPEGVFSIGRAGSYLYSVDIDDCIEQAIEIGVKL
jgi:UDP-galactopyranose mutase